MKNKLESGHPCLSERKNAFLILHVHVYPLNDLTAPSLMTLLTKQCFEYGPYFYAVVFICCSFVSMEGFSSFKRRARGP